MYRDRYRERLPELKVPAKITCGHLEAGDLRELSARVHKRGSAASLAVLPKLRVPRRPLYGPVHDTIKTPSRGYYNGTGPEAKNNNCKEVQRVHTTPQTLHMPRIFISHKTSNFIVILPDGDVLEGTWFRIQQSSPRYCLDIT